MATADYKGKITINDTDIVNVMQQVVTETLVPINIGNVSTTTLAAGSQATAQASTSSNNTLSFTFGIPKGDKGDKGDRGPAGPAGSIGTISGGAKSWGQHNINVPSGFTKGTLYPNVGDGNRESGPYAGIKRDAYGRVIDFGIYYYKYNCNCDCSTGND